MKAFSFLTILESLSKKLSILRTKMHSDNLRVDYESITSQLRVCCVSYHSLYILCIYPVILTFCILCVLLVLDPFCVSAKKHARACVCQKKTLSLQPQRLV